MSIASNTGNSSEYAIDPPVVDAERSGQSQLDAPKPRGSAGFLFFAHRIFTHRFPVGDGVNRFSEVMVSLTEVFPDGPGGALNVPGIGAATMKVYNVAPRDDGTVDVRGEIDWDNDIPIWVNFLF